MKLETIYQLLPTAEVHIAPADYGFKCSIDTSDQISQTLGFGNDPETALLAGYDSFMKNDTAGSTARMAVGSDHPYDYRVDAWYLYEIDQHGGSEWRQDAWVDQEKATERAIQLHNLEMARQKALQITIKKPIFRLCGPDGYTYRFIIMDGSAVVMADGGNDES